MIKHPFFKPYVESTLGDVPKREKKQESSEEDIKPYSEREEDEQVGLMYELQTLVAERSDLIKTRGQKEKAAQWKLSQTAYDQKRGTEKRSEATDEGTENVTAHAHSAWTMKRVGARLIRVPAKAAQPDRKTYAEEAQTNAKTQLEEIEKKLKTLGKIPGMHEAYENKLAVAYYLIKAQKAHERRQLRIAEIDEQIGEIREQQGLGQGGAIKGADREQIRLLEKEKVELLEKTKAFDTYEAGHVLRRFYEIKGYAEQIAKGRIVEYAEAKATIDEGLEHMRNHQPFLLTGHLGSGKTEMARHMAKLFMMQNGVGFEPYDPEKHLMSETEYLDQVYDKLSVEVFSGGEEASVYDLVGKLKLVGKSSTDKVQLAANIEQLSEALEKAQVKGLSREQIAGLILGKSDITETLFNYGPLGRALRDETPVIIDEINLVPPEVNGRINDILLRRVGEKVRLQENGEEEFMIKPGTAFLATCNLGTQYAGTKEVNAAFKSRWVAKEVEYPSVESTYDLILAALVRKDRVRLPPNFPAQAFESLTHLAVVTRELQELFSGQTQGMRFMAMSGSSPVAERAQLEKSVVSTRDLMRKIVLVWKQKDFSVPLDEIIAKNILAAEVFSKDDQKLMAEIFIRRGFFQGWSETKFKTAGISSISKAELDALQAARTSTTSGYQAANQKYDDLLREADTRSSALKSDLLVGNMTRAAA